MKTGDISRNWLFVSLSYNTQKDSKERGELSDYFILSVLTDPSLKCTKGTSVQVIKHFNITNCSHTFL